MAQLYIFNKKIESIFQLLGENENDISYSVGYAFANCRKLLENFLIHLKIKSPFNPDKIIIRLQAHEKGKGFTDFEIIQENEFHIIIEAKGGWNFPSAYQLEKYAARPNFISSKVKHKRIIVFNESIPAFTSAHFGITNVFSIPVQVVAWNDIKNLASISKSIGRDAENRILNELKFYLEKISTMQKIDSNLVYVVSLSKKTPDNWLIKPTEVVNKYYKYFHPVGGGKGGWPSEPPNYIAFRYKGQLQSIHQIEKYEVFIDPPKQFMVRNKQKQKPHYLYHLGPAIKPGCIVKTGIKITRNMRVWAALDLLLTSSTIQQTRDKTKERSS